PRLRPARTRFDHKGGSERRTYSQGLTGRQGVAWFGIGRARYCEHWEAPVGWSGPGVAPRTGGGVRLVTRHLGTKLGTPKPAVVFALKTEISISTRLTHSGPPA